MCSDMDMYNKIFWKNQAFPAKVLYEHNLEWFRVFYEMPACLLYSLILHSEVNNT